MNKADCRGCARIPCRYLILKRQIIASAIHYAWAKHEIPPHHQGYQQKLPWRFSG